jgi:uncharacterized protein YeaC (DUF1315 family)
MSEFFEKSQQLSPEMIERFKTALQVGKWPDGQPVSDKQKATLTQAIIIYDNANLPAGQRVGETDDQCASKSNDNDAKTIRWQ